MSTTDKSFAGHPKSIAEVRAAQAGDGSIWTPRDALINTLRDLDEGKIEPTDLLILFNNKEGALHHIAATRDPTTALGLCARMIRG